MTVYVLLGYYYDHQFNDALDDLHLVSGVYSTLEKAREQAALVEDEFDWMEIRDLPFDAKAFGMDSPGILGLDTVAHAN